MPSAMRAAVGRPRRREETPRAASSCHAVFVNAIRYIRALACLSAVLVALSSASCGNSSGSATFAGLSPELPAQLPLGSGGVAIDMSGMWSIEDAVIIESNSVAPTPPLNGTLFEMEPTRIAAIGGLSVAPSDLAILVGVPLVSYVNVVDSSTVFYGIIVDQRASGGLRVETALAGGSVGPDTISIEAYNSTQAPNEVVPTFTRARYRLARVAGTTPLLHRPEELDFVDFVSVAFGDN